jgi:hypothetical protein
VLALSLAIHLPRYHYSRLSLLDLSLSEGMFFSLLILASGVFFNITKPFNAAICRKTIT